MADPNSPYWPRDIGNVQPWEKPPEENPAETYDAYRRGFTSNGSYYPPMPKNEAYDTTRFFFKEPASGLPSALQQNPGKFQMPQHDWTQKQYEDYMSKTPMSNLNLISSLLKAG